MHFRSQNVAPNKWESSKGLLKRSMTLLEYLNRSEAVHHLQIISVVWDLQVVPSTKLPASQDFIRICFWS